MLNVNEFDKDDEKNIRLYEVLCWANEALPQSESLWQAKLQYLLNTDQEQLAEETFKKVTIFTLLCAIKFINDF